eukprot:m.168392 g.168392  ORF g.168392 m.168392 type:complete len:199 (+) comp25079_c1_seq6:50-646(+)
MSLFSSSRNTKQTTKQQYISVHKSITFLHIYGIDLFLGGRSFFLIIIFFVFTLFYFLPVSTGAFCPVSLVFSFLDPKNTPPYLNTSTHKHKQGFQTLVTILVLSRPSAISPEDDLSTDVDSLEHILSQLKVTRRGLLEDSSRLCQELVEEKEACATARVALNKAAKQQMARPLQLNRAWTYKCAETTTAPPAIQAATI